jgi:hypothetical protein
MTRALPILQAPLALEDLQIASPCHADWADMRGDDRVRFCGACRKNVYNLAGMTRREATALVTAREGNVCIRMFRRADGTVLTADCPVGVRAALRRARREVLLAATTGVAAMTALIAFLGGTATKKTCARLDETRTTLIESASNEPPPPPPPPLMGAAPPPGSTPMTPVLGDVAVPAPPPPPAGPALMGKPAAPPALMGEAVVRPARMGLVARPR